MRKQVLSHNLSSLKGFCHTCFIFNKRIKDKCDSGGALTRELCASCLLFRVCCQDVNIKGQVKIDTVSMSKIHLHSGEGNNMEYKRRSKIKRINNAVVTLRACKSSSEKKRRAYNCQRLDFFFSGRAGFSFEALRERIHFALN